jgi:aromatic-amino-acid transaminase
VSFSTVSSNPSALIPQCAGQPANDPIFQLNAEARGRAEKGESILNATLGVLLREDGSLAVMECVTEARSRVSLAESAGYAPISGNPAFIQAAIRDLFPGGPLAGLATAVATPGATGAVHHSVLNFLEPGQRALAPSYYWGPYRVITSHAGRGIDTFNMFTPGGRLDIDAFAAALTQHVERQGRALVIFNFPCNNPTGYSLDEQEWSDVVEIVDRAARRAPVSFLLDYAYASFGGDGARRWLHHAERMLESATLLVAWTASKAFAQYGSRVGTLVAVHRDAGERDRIQAALNYSCRGTWSNCNHLGMLTTTRLLSDADLRRTASREREALIGLLAARVTRFNEAAAAAGLSYPRYEGGFFVSVFTEDADRTAQAMKAEGVFVVPMQGAVRVALCATPEDEIPRLVESLAAGVRAERSIGSS